MLIVAAAILVASALEACVGPDPHDDMLRRDDRLAVIFGEVSGKPS